MMYPNHVFPGVVESVGWGIDPQMSITSDTLLPIVSPKLDWIRLAQRFPVRIRIINPDQEKFPLRVGANARVKIYTQAKVK